MKEKRKKNAFYKPRRVKSPTNTVPATRNKITIRIIISIKAMIKAPKAPK
jgi:hypothetical protein